ncbi:VWA domain-containing protein [Desulfonatronovibrio magnus]|uniref:VWA domain-containing protein n=1 Tax=Desulfonatronovibrio magnus TaxID=698827 RepID=UPI0005EBD386|nr:VWA domain-containing protein [Desulfonatronovibrio magnus]
MLSPPQMISLATTLARKNKVDVKFDNSSTAATDGKTIILPLTSKENSWIVRGYLDHEIGHVRLTDFGTIPKKTALHKSLWNILEDIRIEQRMSELYPGMATNHLKLITELLTAEPGIFEVKPGDHPAGIICGYLVLLLRTQHLKQTVLNDLEQKADQVFQSAFGSELQKDMLDIVLPYSRVQSPEDVSEMVEDLLQLLSKHLQKQKERQPKPDSSEQKDSKPESESDRSGTQDSTNSEKRYIDSSNSENTENLDDQPGNSELYSEGPASRATDTIQAIKEALNSTEEQQDIGTQLKNLALEKESQERISRAVAIPAKEKVIRDFGYTPQEIKAPSKLVSKLSANLRGLLQAQVLDHSRPGLSGNRIARNQVHKIRTGEPRLFLRRSPVKQVNTAVHILLDNSSSMRNYYRFEIAKNTTLALLRSLSYVRGINLALSIFPAVYPYHLSGGSETVPVAEIRRQGNKILYPAKPKGSTPLAPAVRLAASRLWELTESRKILLIITDGEPDSRVEAEIAIKEAIDLAIEVVCLGIEDVAYPEIFPIYEIVKDVKGLPHKAFNLFEQLLTTQP